MGRRLGQHFLRDPGILDRIVDALDPHPADLVLEVGAGEGTLTARLARRVAHVVTIEKDRELARRLDGADVGANVTVVEGDALRLDWAELLTRGRGAVRGPHKVAGNIPYYITSPLIDRALGPPVPAVVVLLVQREVADRVASGPGSRTYGALSVGVQAVARAERLFTVKAGAFSPPPRVDSAVLRLVPLDPPLVAPADRPAFRRFVTGLFSRRRKQLGRSLRDLASLDRDVAASVLGQAGIGRASRPESLSPATTVQLWEIVRELTAERTGE